MPRVENYTVGSYLHVIKRGARGMEIVRDEADRWRFIKSLYYLNNANDRIENWDHELYLQETPLFHWPPNWPEREKLVDIAAFTLMPNHFHLLLREIREGGVSLFMQGFCTSMTKYFNEKYHEKGSIFQGAFKARNVTDDRYLRRTAMYIMVKNSFELLPEGLNTAIENFEDAWLKSINYSFSSLADYGGMRNSPIIDKGLLGELFTSPKEFKAFAKDTMLGRALNLDIEF